MTVLRPTAVGDQDLAAYAEATGLDVDQFDREMVARAHVERVRADCTSGVRSGVNGTPSFVINGRRHNGSYDFGTVLATLEAALDAETTASAARGLR